MANKINVKLILELRAAGLSRNVYIPAKLYQRSGGTDTAVPEEQYRQTGTGTPFFISCFVCASLLA